MSDTTAEGERARSLGVALWLFIVWKGAGILFNLPFVLIVGVLLLPAQLSLSGGLDPGLAFRGVFLLAEIVASGIGIGLILMRHRTMRAFWLSWLSLCIVAVCVDLFIEVQEEVMVFLASYVGWLLYWVVAKRPRELQLAALWVRPS